MFDIPAACNTDYWLVVTNVRERLSVGKLATSLWFGEIRSGGAKRGISLKFQRFGGLETRGGLQKIWEGMSECQLRPVCLTQDADSLVSTAQSKHHLPQFFWVHSASRAKFSASAVALVDFGRLSEGYYQRCFFSLLSSTVKSTETWKAIRLSPGRLSLKQEKMILYNIGFFRLWRGNPTELFSN